MSHFNFPKQEAKINCGASCGVGGVAGLGVWQWRAAAGGSCPSILSTGGAQSWWQNGPGLFWPCRWWPLGKWWVVLGQVPRPCEGALTGPWRCGRQGWPCTVPGAWAGLSWQLSQGHAQLRSKSAELLMPITKRVCRQPLLPAPTTLVLPWD